MRVFEILLLIALAIAIGDCFDQWRSRPASARRFQLPALACLLLLVHLFLEGSRWQMVPAYFLAPILLLLGLRTVNHAASTGGARAARLLGYASALLCTALTAGLAWGLPVPKLPEPGGAHAIGTFTEEFTDPLRKEYYGPDAEAPRQYMVQVWYPAKLAPGMKTARWWGDAAQCAPVLAKNLGFPGFFLNHTALIDSNTVENAPIELGETKFPILIYSHGWTGFRQVAQDQIERLVSNGYVVVAPDHTYGAIATRFPDGTVYPYNPGALPTLEEAGAAGRQAAIEKLVDSFAGDVMHIIGELEAMNEGKRASILKGRLNLKQIGVFGHSTGGGAITEVAVRDPRVKAALAYDSWVEPVSQDVRGKPLAIPYMSILSEQWHTREGANNAILAPILAQSTAPVYETWLEGSNHNDFTLMALLSPLAYRLNLKGPIDGPHASDLLCTYTLAFFDRHLRGAQQGLLDRPSAQYPELKFAGKKESAQSE
ncbi:MAG: dienelactone hydrolase family protein [Candidatus Hydrogenedentes bacterium]|nr:dienelactone hydrolase family protein [Candidatus Hydrogenedentota bacterium]